MAEGTEYGGVPAFFRRLWRFAALKHGQGAFNSVCLGVLLALPVLALCAALLVCCCHCCCRQGGPEKKNKRKKQKKKKKKESEDLWISMKTTGAMKSDTVALTVA